MADWKTYTMILLSLTTLSGLGLQAMPDPNYACDASETIAYCFSLSSTNNTCYTLPSNAGGKRCTSTWREVNDPIEVTVKEIVETKVSTKNMIVKRAGNNDVFECDLEPTGQFHAGTPCINSKGEEMRLDELV